MHRRLSKRFPNCRAYRPTPMRLSSIFLCQAKRKIGTALPKMLEVLPRPSISFSEAQCEQLLQELVPSRTETCCESECMVEVGDVADRILQIAKDKSQLQSSLVCVRKPVFRERLRICPLQRHTRFVSHARCPVLTVRAEGLLFGFSEMSCLPGPLATDRAAHKDMTRSKAGHVRGHRGT